jgi:cell division protein FtsX
MVIRRVGPLSFAKITGVLYAIMGLVFGAAISVATVVGGMFGAAEEQGSDAFSSMLFGAAAVVALPIFYGVLGFVMALIGAALYNVIARFVGGIEMDVE